MKIGIFSDIHEDIVTLKEAITLFEQLNCSEIACLGDITGFDEIFYKKINNPNASECISIIHANCKYVVAGNHDLYTIKKLPVTFSGFNFPPNWYELDLNEQERLSENKVWLYKNEILSSVLSNHDKEYLESLPETQIVQVDNIRLLFSHSIYPDFTGSLIHRPYNPWDLRSHFQYMKSNYCQFGFSGHMHPGGILRINYNQIKLLSFGVHKIENDYIQYFCPCIAGNSSKNGIIIFDSADMTIEAIKLKVKKKKWFSL